LDKIVELPLKKLQAVLSVAISIVTAKSFTLPECGCTGLLLVEATKLMLKQISLNECISLAGHSFYTGQ
jgi:hypothetical protein